MWIRRKKEVKETEAASPGGSELGVRTRSSFFGSLKEACKRSIDELLTRESISDDMSDHVTEEQQERELQRRFASSRTWWRVTIATQPCAGARINTGLRRGVLWKAKRPIDGLIPT